MATLLELANLRSDSRYEDLVRKVLAAAGVKAIELVAPPATPDANTIAWAKDYLANPRGQADEIINYVVSANDSLTVDQIMDAIDSGIQTNVDAAIDNLLVK